MSGGSVRRRGRRLARSFYRRDALEVAPELLNKVLVHGAREGRIVEVEAYRGALDAASHAHRGPTPRNRTMFGPPGRLYVYFTYGMHWCANVVCHEPGDASAVLVRALAPLRGLDEMGAARPAVRRPVDLANGPAKLCQALGIDGSFDGADLVTAAEGISLLDDGVPPPDVPIAGPRVGIRAAADLPWRFSVPGDPHRSRPW
ncbi:MAG: DNA-3-methyladenine glycosylase [Acidimicrobiales bacterium]|nr:DNA-3-methyladenine glycosylase [Acidimicrobiales bacterium]